MKFSSLEEMISYIEKAQSKATRDMGEEMVDIMKDEIEKQVYSAYSPSDYSRTMQLLDSPQIKYSDSNYVSVEFMNMGDWKSHGYGMSGYNGGGSPFFPMYGLEHGGIWGRGTTNIMDESTSKIEDEIPKCYRDSMNSMGIPIR